MTLITLHNLDLVRHDLKEACPEFAVKEVWDARVDELMDLAEKGLRPAQANARAVYEESHDAALNSAKSAT